MKKNKNNLKENERLSRLIYRERNEKRNEKNYK